MNDEAVAHWNYAKEDLLLARQELNISPRASASRAHYAAFHAVSALFALEGKTFSRHSALESAVHRELVRTKRWPEHIGASYSKLFRLRLTSDYDVKQSVSAGAAEAAVHAAKEIVDAVRTACPEFG